MTTAALPGLTIPIAQYARDDVGAPVPTLNSGLANLLLNRSPWHAWFAHPKLNPDWEERVPSGLMNIGSAAHLLLLEPEREAELVDIPYEDWRTGAAKALRDEALANHRIPLLSHDLAAAQEMADAAREAIAASPDLAGLGGLDIEQTYVWETEHGGLSAWLRCRPDAVARDGRIILSYKTTSTVANPETYVRTLMDGGYDLQMAIEKAGSAAVRRVAPERYVWIVQEMQPPYAVSLIGPAGDMRDYGDARMDRAVGIWAECLANDDWPGYPDRIVAAHVPPWKLREMEAME